MIWLYDLAGDRFVYVSPSVRMFRGFAPEEVIGQRLGESLAPGSRAMVERVLAETLAAVSAGDATARHRVMEVEQIHKDGSVIPTEVVATVLAGGEGGGVQILGVTRNIADRRRAERELRESRDRLAEAERMAHLGNWELDLVNDRLVCSDEFFRIFEVDRERFGASFRAFLDLVHPGDRGTVERIFRESIVDRTPYAVSHRLLFPDGRIKHVLLGGENVYAADGSPLRSLGTVLDITERKRIEEDLQDLVKGLRAWHAVSLVFEQQQHAVEELLAAAVLHIPPAMQHAEDAQALIEYDGRLFRAGAPGELQESISSPICVNQSTRGALTLGYVRRHREGASDTFFVQERSLVDGIARTVGAGLGLREAFSGLRRSEERARTIFENVDVGMFEMNLGGVLARGNRRLGLMLAQPPSALVGLRIETIAAPEHRSSLSALLQNPADRVHPVFNLELLCATGEGRDFWGALTVTLETDANGRPTGFIGVLQDISHEVLARQTLQRFNAELEAQVKHRTEELEARNNEVQALLGSIPDMVMRVRRDGTILYCQRAHGDSPLAGFGCRTDCGHTAGMNEAFRDPVLAIGGRALDERTTVTAEITLGSAEAPFTVELRAAPVGSIEFVVFARDITGRKRLEVEMANMLKKEREISEMKSRFVSVTSHEFRTPMSAVIGSVDMLANHYGRIPPAKRQDLFGRINSSLQHMSGMLDDLLVLNRAESGRMRVALCPVELERFAEDLLEEIRAADRQAHDLELHLNGPVRQVITDPGMLRQVLSNLLSNAVRYSPPGTTVLLRIEADSAGFRLAVEDQGIGVPEADRARIFEPFERGSNVGEIRGTGLGLNIVKRMVELLGGSLQCSSGPGCGSLFTVTLPQPPPKGGEPGPATSIS